MAGLDRGVRRLSAASASAGRGVTPDLGVLLTGRAALAGLARRGRISPGGACRMVRAADGWVAVSLARPDDAAMVPAITATAADIGGDPWSVLAAAARSLPAARLVDRARLLGVPAAVAGRPARADGADPERVERPAGAAPGVPARRPLVVDLSSLWAGPLCAKLLADAGARVVKVESRDRPDGARAGNRAWFDWLHAGHESVVLDFAGERGVLAGLVDAADVVIEGSRPRALAALGIDAGRTVAGRPGRVWLSITGHGRSGPEAAWTAFGDDAAVAAGLLARDAAGCPVFCGDAAADPVTGLLGARAVLDSRARGGGELVSLSMVDAVRSVLGPRPTVPADGRPDAAGPHPPPAAPPAPPAGAHTSSVVRELVGRW